MNSTEENIIDEFSQQIKNEIDDIIIDNIIKDVLLKLTYKSLKGNEGKINFKHKRKLAKRIFRKRTR